MSSIDRSTDPTSPTAVLTALARLYADFAERRETLTETLERDIGFRAAFESASDAVLIADDQGWCVDANPAACFLLGVPDRDSFLSRRISDFALGDGQEQIAQEWRHLLANGEQGGEVVWQPLQGGARHFAFAARANVRRGRHLLVLRDVGERHRLEREVTTLAEHTALLVRLGDLARGEPLADLLDEAATSLAARLAVPVVAIFEHRSGEQDLTLVAGLGWHAAQIDSLRLPTSTGLFEGFALAADEPVITNDLAHETRFAAAQPIRAHGIAGGAAVPIRGRGRRYGVLVAYVTQARTWSDADLALLRGVANILGATFDRRASATPAAARSDAIAPTLPAYRALVHHAPELLLTVTAEGVVRFAGPTSERILGLAPESFHGRSLGGLLHPDDRAAADALIGYSRALAGDAGPLELRFAHRDGGWVWLEIVARDLLADPRVGGILLSGREVTTRRRSEATRRRGDERFGRIFGALPAAIAVATLDEGRIIEVNDHFLHLLGYERDEVIGSTTLDLGILSDVEDRAAIIRRLHDRGSIEEVEVRLATKEGEGRHAIISLGLVSIDGEPCLALLLNDITDRKTAEGHLHRMAHFDAVTGLPNRRYVLTAIERALDQAEGMGGRRIAALFLDLDGFKTVNDRFGHDAGDKVLEEVARRLTASLRAGDLAARYGGDEFTVLLARVASAHEAVAVAERVITALGAPFAVGDARISLSASVGIAIAGQGGRASDLLREADVALYHAKARGRATYAVFEAGMRAAAVDVTGETLH